MSENPHGWTYYGKGPDGVEMALSLPIDPALSAADIAKQLGALHAALHTAGFRRSDRLDKPVGGWGGNKQQAKQDAAPPAELVVPVHCELNMVYVPERAETPDRKAVAAHWDCRKGRGCATPRENSGNTYPFTDWHMTKKPIEKPAQPAQDGAQPSKAPLAERLGAEPATMGERPMEAKEWVEFWKAVRAMGYDRPKVFELAADVLTGHGPSMTDVEFTKLGKLAVHRVFVALKEKHEVTA